MLPVTSTRRRVIEWMDDPGADPQGLRQSLAYIRKINRWLGYTRVILRHLGQFSRQWQPGQSVRILDVATGSADIPQAILRWGRRRNFDVRVVGLDLNPTVILEAAAVARRTPGLSIVRGDALNLPFADASFDYVLTSMFLHHLTDDEVCRALAEMGRVARRGIIASDLLRARRAYVIVRLLTLASPRMVKHDARVSVAQAFSHDEVKSLRDRAGLHFADYTYYLGHRFVLAGEKLDF